MWMICEMNIARFNVLALVTSCSLLSACNTEYAAIYQNVNAESKWDENARLVIEHAEQALPPYIVQNNELYLMIREQRDDWYFRSVVNYPSWDKTEISDLLSSHADIQSMVPVDWNNWLPKGFGDECKSGESRDPSREPKRDMPQNRMAI